MIYVFTFLGEFGYELFNWQGLVRKFKSTCSADDKIVGGGRTGMDIWYPYADAFVDISDERPRQRHDDQYQNRPHAEPIVIGATTIPQRISRKIPATKLKPQFTRSSLNKFRTRIFIAKITGARNLFSARISTSSTEFFSVRGKTLTIFTAAKVINKIFMQKSISIPTSSNANSNGVCK